MIDRNLYRRQCQPRGYGPAVRRSDSLCAAATVADNLLMTLYFFALIAFAGMRFFPGALPPPPHRRGSLRPGDRRADPCRRLLSRKGHLPPGYRPEPGLLHGVVCGSPADRLPSFAHWSRNRWRPFAGGLLDFAGRFFGSQYVGSPTLSVAAATFFDRQVERNPRLPGDRT